MAKRKPVRSAARKRAAGKRTRPTGGRPRRKAARKSAKTLARRAGAARARTGPASRKGSKPAARKRAVKRPARPSRPASAAARARKTAKKGAGPRRTLTKKSTPQRSEFGKREGASHRLQIERDRRILEETVPGPPSTLDFERHASAARSGRAEIREALTEHTEASPRLTGGDVDADWENAFSTGDESPGGDTPTPDQDIVDEIGASLGVQYNDDEELKAVDKIEERDRNRWELDPASSDDYRDRTKK